MKTIVFAGGGTGGHVIPNIALIELLRDKYNCVYVGGDGIEKHICAKEGVPFFHIDTVKFRRDKPIELPAIPFKLAACVKKAKSVLAEIKPDLVFSKGGYAALPVVLAAKCPVICHESDCTPGLTTKLSKRKSKLVLCSFAPCAQKLGRRAEYAGSPISGRLYGGKASPEAYGFNGKKPILAVVGGSSGATNLNNAIIAALDKLKTRFDIVHVTGKGKADASKQAGYTPIEYEYDMPRLYATCDAIITRAGAGAIAECIALKIPTLAVPLEHASRGDQIKNAEYYCGLGAIKHLREAELNTDNLITALDDLIKNKYKYIAAMSSLAVDGTKKICDIIEKELGVNS